MSTIEAGCGYCHWREDTDGPDEAHAKADAELKLLAHLSAAHGVVHEPYYQLPADSPAGA